MENQAEILKNRTKQFALRIIRVIRSLPPDRKEKSSLINCCVRGCQWRPTTELFAAPARGRSFSLNSQS